jgi:glutathione S-transferase
LLLFSSEINPMAQVPAIVDGRFKLFERYAMPYQN